MTLADKLDRLLLSRAALKGVIQDLERVFGVKEALPVTRRVLVAINASDRLARVLKRADVGLGTKEYRFKRNSGDAV